MDRPLSDLTCPKCGGSMRAVERQGVVIDLCGECRGIFLDRGELDRLLDLEAAAARYEEPVRAYDVPGRRYVAQAGYDVPPGAWGERRYEDDRDDDRDDDDRRYRGGPRSRRGFLGDLLEGFGD